MNPSLLGTPTSSVSGTMQGAVCSSLWINKLKIVGSGHNWAVAPCEPFYLMGTEPPAPETALTGAKNLIEHYGLGNAYQKFCSKPLREELSAFLPHLSGNVDVPASVDGSGLMSLIERPPIRGKELHLFAPSQLDNAFRLHPGPLPQEYSSLFTAVPTRNSRRSNLQGHSDVPTGATSCSRVPATAAPGLNTFARRRRRFEVHRGLCAANSSIGSFAPASSMPVPLSDSPSTGATPLSTPVSAGSAPTQPSVRASSVPFALPSSDAPGVNAPSGKPIEHPPGLILVSSHLPPSTRPTDQQHLPPPPPPLLAPAHSSSQPTSQRLSHTSAHDLSSSSCAAIIPGPPVLQSIHASNSLTTGPGSSAHTLNHPPSYGIQPPTQTIHTSDLNKSPSSGRGGSGSSPPSPELHRTRRLDGLDEERRRKKRKEKKRRKDRD
ncbi:unnamed protein product [Dicrocoelium dendriticum]|nr:unnamed protein product [Dicrocoelium dendriticum]